MPLPYSGVCFWEHPLSTMSSNPTMFEALYVVGHQSIEERAAPVRYWFNYLGHPFGNMRDLQWLAHREQQTPVHILATLSSNPHVPVQHLNRTLNCYAHGYQPSEIAQWLPVGFCAQAGSAWQRISRRNFSIDLVSSASSNSQHSGGSMAPEWHYAWILKVN